MPRPLKRSITLRGHKTSLALEPAFWSALEEVAAAEGRTLTETIARIDDARGGADGGGLSSAVRVYVLEALRSRGKT